MRFYEMPILHKCPYDRVFPNVSSNHNAYIPAFYFVCKQRRGVTNVKRVRCCL